MNRDIHAVAVENATKRFKDIIAVDGLSFTVARGEIFGLLGPNGAGKTTMLNLITGLLKRDSGAISVFEHDPQREARAVRRLIGVVAQHTNVYGDLNALDNLWHHAALYCDDLGGVKARIEKLLKMMSLWERRKDPVRTYSGGMKRRLALARALLHEPSVVFFDEPTLGVDVQGRRVLWEHIREERKKGITFIVSTNDMAEADMLCDRLLIIDHGKAIQLDTPENLKNAIKRDTITLRTTPPIADPEEFLMELPVSEIKTMPDGGLRLEAAGGEAIIGEIAARVNTDYHLEMLSIARPTLEDVFLHHTGRALRE